MSVHEVNTRTHFPDGLLKSKRHGVLRDERLEYHRLSKDHLYWALPVDGENISYMQGHFIAELGFPISRFAWKPHVDETKKLDYYIDIVNLVEHSDSSWHYRDLYFDIALYEGQRADILDTDEYLAACEAGYLDAEEASFAVEKLHDVLNLLAKHAYSLEAILRSRNISLEWV